MEVDRKRKFQDDGLSADSSEDNGSSHMNKSLFICTMESNHTTELAYCIRAIKVSDLFSFDTLSKFLSDSDTSTEEDKLVLQEVVSLEGSDMRSSDLPYKMGCGVLGSQFVLAGGLMRAHYYKPSRHIYVFETSPTADSKPEFRRGCSSKLVAGDESKAQHDVIPEFNGKKSNPLVVEIENKLYIMAGAPSNSNKSPFFEVFNPKENEWKSLPEPPLFVAPLIFYGFRLFAYAVVGTKILVCSVNVPSPVFCFDVATQLWIEIPHIPRLPFWGKALVLDLEGDDDHKMVFAVDHLSRDLRVYQMTLTDGTPSAIESVVTFGSLPEFYLDLYTCAQVGDRRVCFVFTSNDCYESCKRSLIAIDTYEFSFSEFPEESADSSAAPLIGGRYLNVKLVGLRGFPFKCSDKGAPRFFKVGGCAVLPR